MVRIQKILSSDPETHGPCGRAAVLETALLLSVCAILSAALECRQTNADTGRKIRCQNAAVTNSVLHRQRHKRNHLVRASPYIDDHREAIAGWLKMTRQHQRQPDRLRHCISIAQRDGIISTIRASAVVIAAIKEKSTTDAALH